MNKLMIVSISLLILNGCTAYQEKGNWQQYLLLKSSGGYTEQKTGPQAYTVEYEGVAALGMPKTRLYWDQRAAELCLGKYNVIEKNEEYYSTRNYSGTPGITTEHRHPRIKGRIECKIL